MTSTDAPSKFTVAILPLGHVDSEQIKLTAGILEEEFGVKTFVLPETKTPVHCFNLRRGCYQVDKLLDYLFSKLPENAQRIMGIIDGKLEDGTCDRYVGYADTGSRVAIYSVPHPDEKPEEEQINKQTETFCLVVHEFGHTLGLKHCSEAHCAMNDTTFNLIMCPTCRRWADREIKIVPESAEDKFSLAEIYYLKKCLPQAAALYREAIRLAPLEPLYHHSLSIVLYLLEQFDEYKLEVVKTIAHSGDHNGFHYTCGLTCLRNNAPDEAEGHFTNALAVTKNPQKTHKLIGQAYREIRHDVELASYHYKEYLRLGGDDQDVIDWLISRGQLDPT